MEKFNKETIVNSGNIMFGTEQNATEVKSLDNTNVIELDAKELNFLNVNKKIAEVLVETTRHIIGSVVIIHNFDQAAITVQSALTRLARPMRAMSALFVSEKLEFVPTILFQMSSEEIVGRAI